MDNARRSRSLAVGGGTGLVATAAWGASVWLAPPVPGNAALATVAVFTAVAAAGWLRRGRSGIVAALTAGFVGSWGIVAALQVMMPRVPDRWVPSIVTMAMDPAANVRESRIETVDPYIALLFLGTMMGAVLVVALLPRLHRRLLAWLVPPVHPSPVPQVRETSVCRVARPRGPATRPGHAARARGIPFTPRAGSGRLLHRPAHQATDEVPAEQDVDQQRRQ